MNKDKNGFSVVELLIILAVLGVIGLVGWKVVASRANNDNKTTDTVSEQKQTTVNEDNGLVWQETADGWKASQTAPACTEQPMLKAPADLSKVTSVLYPGQTRGGNYKPHGGLRFDDIKDNKVTVTAPIDGYIVKGARYFAEGTKEVQYYFDVMNNCGVMYRIGHIKELPTSLQQIADTWPQPTASSASQNVNPAVFMKQGDVLATQVGISEGGNTFFDWGVYDYRQQNEASKSASYQSAHSNDKYLSWHAVCWLNDWLPSSDLTKLSSLPAGDPTSGKNSDYCK